ncbi:transmembrane protein 126A-like [Lissotriton helveticus]
MSAKGFVEPDSSQMGRMDLSRPDVMAFLIKKLEQLPEGDRKVFAYGSVFIGINSSFAGLIGNSFFRRILNVTQARFTSSLPMAVLPFLTTVIVYNGAVTTPLLSGDLNCATCAVVRGALAGSVVGGLYPIALALPINAGLAARYSSAPMPEKGNMLRFWMSVSKPVFKRMSYVFILQAVFGAYISSRHYSLYLKMLQLPEPRADAEELKE